MCLRELDKKIRKRGGFGFKLLLKDVVSGVPRTEIQRNVLLPVGKWKTDPNASETRHTETFNVAPVQAYPTGFHIFPTLDDLRNWQGRMGWRNLSVFKVQFKEVVASGLQQKSRIIVARKVKVIEEVK